MTKKNMRHQINTRTHTRQPNDLEWKCVLFGE